MLSSFSVQNFKSIKEASVELGCLTVLVGANNSGKSTFLQGLALLKQSIRKVGLVSQGRYVNLMGDFAEFSRGGRLGRPDLLSFSLNLNVTGPNPLNRDAAQMSYSIEYDMSFDAQGLVRHAGRYLIAEPPLRFEANPRRYGDYSVPAARRIDGTTVTFIPSSLVGLPFRFDLDNVAPLIHRAWNDTRLKIEQFLKNVFLVPTLRGLEAEDYEPGPASPDIAEGREVVTLLEDRLEIRDEVAEQAYRIMGSRIDVATTEAGRLRVEVPADDQAFQEGAATSVGGARSGVQGSAGRRRDYSIHLLNEGAGLRYLVWPLAQIAAAPDGSVVCIEEPEIHLHPAAQAAFCDVLVESGRHKQIVLTTQSEHILTGLLVNVAEGKLGPRDLRVYYLQWDSDVQGSVPRPLPVEEEGTVEGALPGFFEADAAELARRIEAIGRRSG